MENLFIMVPRKSTATLALTSPVAGGARPAVNYAPDARVTSITLQGATTAAPTYTVNLNNVEDGFLFRMTLTDLNSNAGAIAASKVEVVRGGTTILFDAANETAALLAVAGGLQFAGALLDGSGLTATATSSSTIS